jgi:uncharacterized protein with HEPN domain
MDRRPNAARRVLRHQWWGKALIQVWIVRHLEIMGEAARGLTSEFRLRHPEIPWRQVGALRNVFDHECFDIDLEEVWAVVEGELAALHTAVRAILELG